MGVDVLVLGGSGMIGGYLLAHLARRSVSHAGTFHTQTAGDLLPLDVRSWAEVSALFAHTRPRIAVMAAGLTGPRHDAADVADSHATNVLGVRHVVEEANRVHARVVYLSSPEIFDGTDEKYGESDPPRPRSELGRQQLAGEHIVAAHAHESLIVRTTDVFGADLKNGNALAPMLDALAVGRDVTVRPDRVTTPTAAWDLADALWTLVESGHGGVFHVAGIDWDSEYEVALAAARAFDLDVGLVRAASPSSPDGTTPRPERTSSRLVVFKAERALGRRLAGYASALSVARAMTQARGVVSRGLRPKAPPS